MDRKYVVLIGLGFELVGLTLAGLYVGSLADQNYNWGGLGVVSGAVVALIAWLGHLIAVVRKLDF